MTPEQRRIHSDNEQEVANLVQKGRKRGFLTESEQLRLHICLQLMRIRHQRRCGLDYRQPMETYLYEEMFRLEERHWWFAAKHQIVLALLRRAMAGRAAGPVRAKVADLGCGCGRMLELLGRDYDAVGVDASPVAMEFAHQRGVKIELGVLPDGLPLPAESCDAVLMLDVLEHLDDDMASARAAARLLKQDGVLLVTVPAYQWLYGPHDAAHHHRRRYTRPAVVKMLESAGLQIRYASYYNTLLFPLAVAERFGRKLGGSNKAVSTEPPAGPVNAMFRSIFAFERHLVGRVRLPWGLSVIALAVPKR